MALQCPGGNKVTLQPRFAESPFLVEPRVFDSGCDLRSQQCESPRVLGAERRRTGTFQIKHSDQFILQEQGNRNL